MIGEELSGDEALTALRHYGGRKLFLDAFSRFRYADGFSYARSLAFQVVLGIVPFAIALVGVAASVHTDSVGRVVELTLGHIVPGASNELVEEASRTPGAAPAAVHRSRSPCGWGSASPY